jgi:ZIP family zinc transporter
LGEAAFWGIVTTSSLLIGGAIALLFRPRRAIVGLVLAFGAGALISAVAYELLGEAVFERDTSGVLAGLIAGALVYVVGDILITRAGGGERKGAEAEEDSSGLAIVLGTVLDGIPESFVLGLTLIGDDLSIAFIAAVFVSNLPEAVGATSSLASSGWSRARIMGMWAGLAVLCIVFAMLGYAMFESAEGATGRRVEAFAAGAILAMLADTMMPEGFKQGGNWAGMATVFGFILAVTLRLAE